MFNGDSRTADKFVVRMPDGMRERIAEVAQSNHRSMNSEIIGRLEDSISADEPRRADINSAHLSDDEKAIVLAVRDLTKSKRKALMQLLASDQ